MKKYLYSNKKLFISSIVLSIFVVLSDIGIAFIFKRIFNFAHEGTIIQFKRLVLFSLVFVSITYIISFLQQNFQARYIKNTSVRLRQDVFKKIINKDILNFSGKNSANYISILMNDLKIIQEDYFNSIFDIISNIFRFVLSAWAILYINVRISICIFIIVILSIYLPLLFSKKISNCKKGYSDSLSKYTIKIKDILSGFQIIKSFNIEEKIIDEHSKYNKNVEDNNYKYKKITIVADIMSNIMGFALFFTSLIVGIHLVISKKLTVGELIAITQLMNNIKFPIITISSKFNILKGSKPIIDKIEKILNSEKSSDKLIEKNEFNDNIFFKNVSFSYKDDRKILRNVSFTIKKNKKYAIIGPSGSGKSTILKLLLGYFDNFDGEIFIDDINMKLISKEYIYRLISVIQQDIYMFDSSIEENIKLFGEYSNEELKRAIKLSGLEPLIDKLNGEIKTKVGENGSNLSGGEKQRVSIARSIIKNTPIMILDEATSSLDKQTALNIENSILSLKNTTCIVVTHKLNENILKKYDEIIFIKEGEICEIGSFNQLMDNKKNFYDFYSSTLDSKYKGCVTPV
ncbi:ABC transporter ATP-binding protein [Anaerosalibacter massiliensis]|uniref:ABC transporter ATP-binding protein/permease n=1 Tax=Anaerosalibacter massiliensis TaxID=1347392 RepID=A0A9X2MI50_9FIRM|nr:ABC transporter ATP-binding protein [Anaerosalibacter massiliensis]MCR2044124.1 ABC transporter ATP-binding protein/permease [Anaerosalibacter massiliensis]